MGDLNNEQKHQSRAHSSPSGLEAAQEDGDVLEQERDAACDEARMVEKVQVTVEARVDALNTVLAVERERTAA